MECCSCYNMNNKILIIGSEGFIGNNLVRYFLQAGYAVGGADLFETASQKYEYFRVSRLSPEWEDVLSAHQFDFCINVAGSANVPYSIIHPFLDFEANVLDTIRILDVIRRRNPKCKYLCISSAAVYGDPQTLPVTEAADKSPLSPYGWHKLMAEQICQEYFQIYGISTAIIRPFSVYGNGLRKQLLWDICTKLKKSDSITLFGTGNESRDFIQIKDFCRLSDCVLRNAVFQSDIFNAASGIETSIRDVARIFEQRYHGKKVISFTKETRSGDPINWHADISKVKSLGFAPSVSLKTGVEEYINWYESLG